MAFFGITGGRAVMRAPAVSDDFLHRNECAACPLNSRSDLRHPHMPAAGSAHSPVYFLGESPGAAEDKSGRHFTGPAGKILRHHLRAEWYDRIRWNNCVRTRPVGDKTPGRIEVECCRPSVARDINAVQPLAIVGFGNVPLSWAKVADSGISVWSGRRTPILVEGQPYWFFPVVHPSSIQYDSKWRGLQSSWRYGSEGEFQFALHVQRAVRAALAGLPDPVVHTPDVAEDGVAWVDGTGGDSDLERVLAFLSRAQQRKLAGLDWETSGLRPYQDGARILTASVTSGKSTLAFPLDHSQAGWTKGQRARLDDGVREFLYSRVRKVAHHLSFEMEWAAYFYGAECLRAGLWGDSLAQAYVLDERPGGHSLDFLVKQYFGLSLKAMSSLNVAALDDEPLPKVLRYNGLDSKYGAALYRAQRAELAAVGLSAQYASHLERVPTAVLTQLKGVPVNQASVFALGKKYIPRMAGAARAVRTIPEVRAFERKVGRAFRPSAAEDVRVVANKFLGFSIDTADESALDGIDHEFARRVIEWRKAAKIYGTYIMPAADAATAERLERRRRKQFESGSGAEFREMSSSRVFPDGFFHPQTNVNRTRTTRTSSHDPNYQNWPKRGSADAVEIRGVVEPASPDEVIVSFDFGQIQARNVGMESRDPALLKAFWEDYDIHHDFMEQLVRIHPAWVKEGARELLRKDDVGKKLAKKYRNDVKHGFVFASFFGAAAPKVASVLDIPLSAAEKLGEIFWDRFGGIEKWHSKIERDYYRTGYVTGLSGYRRHAPVSYNERINTPIQGDEAAIVLDAMTRLSKIDHDLLQATMEIHDDLTFVWPRKRVDELSEIVLREMLTTPFAWARVTPIVVEMSVGDNWASLKEVGVFSSHKYDGIDMPRRMPL